ncbi:MAG: efflux RND transporter periplasmic adaptor subunit [Smithella sp.]|jgi:membrane fusion protein (multidrug efflux system)|nr:efflux RND transporter periplasmic adaptor subunit [Smithella sp.]
MKKNDIKRWSITVAIIFAAGFIVSGCGKKNTGGHPPTPEVAVITIKTEAVVTTTELTGRTSANLVAEVRPQVGGIIQKRLFTEGSDVQAGQVLYQIDPATYQAALDNARAGLARSEANLSAIRLKADRLRELLVDKAVSRQDYDDAASALKQTQADIQYWQANVDTARINLKYTSITAPISGRIGKSSVTEGALVAVGQSTALATIQKLDPMYVDITQSTADLLRLQRGVKEGRLNQSDANQRKVQLILEDGSTYPLSGTLQFRDVTVDPTTGSVILRAVFPNPNGVLLPGMFIRAVVKEGINEKALLVPQQAVSRDPKGNPQTLIVDAENKVALRTLALDRAIGDQWLVASGLAAGERVIVEGMQKVKPGVSVKVVPFEAGQEKNSASPKNMNPPPAKKN